MEQSHCAAFPAPWAREGVMTRMLLTDGAVNGKQRFHKIDCWHALHLGVGKSWAAGALLLMSSLVPEGNIDKRNASLSSQYRTFCKREKLDPITRAFDKHSFGASGESNGTWNKAAVTSNLLKFVESWCTSNYDAVMDDERLRIVVSSARTGERFLLCCVVGLQCLFTRVS